MGRFVPESFRGARIGDVVIPKKGRYKDMQGIVERHWDFTMFPTNKLCVVFYPKQLNGTLRKDVQFYKSKHLEVCHFLPLLNRQLHVGDEVYLLANPQIPLDVISDSKITTLRQKIMIINLNSWNDYFFISEEGIFTPAQIDINKTNLLLTDPDGKATNEPKLPTL